MLVTSAATWRKPRKRTPIMVRLDTFDGFNYPTSYASMSNSAGYLLDEDAMSKPFGTPEEPK